MITVLDMATGEILQHSTIAVAPNPVALHEDAWDETPQLGLQQVQSIRQPQGMPPDMAMLDPVVILKTFV